MRKTVLITGSGNGIGEALALEFSNNNYNVIIHARKQAELEELSKKISEKGVACYYIQGDLRNDKTLYDLYTIAKEKDISILINNAAKRCPGVYFEEIIKEDLDDLIRVSIYVPIRLTQMIYPIFQSKMEGAIVNINSITALEPKKLRSISSAVKYGLRGFTDCLRIEARSYNIKLIGVYLTRVKTKPEHEYGIDRYDIAAEIYRACESSLVENIIFEGRPEKYRTKDMTKYTTMELKNEQ